MSPPKFNEASHSSMLDATIIAEAVAKAVTAVMSQTQNAQQTASKPQHPQIALPIYTGSRDENLRGWLHRFEKAAEIYGWNDTQKRAYCRTYMDGPADYWLNNRVVSQPGSDSWDQMKKDMLEKFLPPDHQVTQKVQFFQQKQLPSETVEEFGCRLLTLAHDIEEKLTDKDIVATFISGLKPTIWKAVYPTRPETYESALETAKRVEETEHRLDHPVDFKAHNAPHSKPTKPPIYPSPVYAANAAPNYETREDYDKEINRLIAERNQRFGYKPFSGRARKFCSHCRRPGHTIEECYKKEKQNPDQPLPPVQPTTTPTPPLHTTDNLKAQ